MFEEQTYLPWGRLTNQKDRGLTCPGNLVNYRENQEKHNQNYYQSLTYAKIAIRI